MARESSVHGITVATFHAGVSLVTPIPTGAYLLGRDIVTSTGGTLKIGGLSMMSADMLAIPSGSFPLSIGGPAPLYISAAGATVTAHVVSYLSQGYNMPGVTVIP